MLFKMSNFQGFLMGSFFLRDKHCHYKADVNADTAGSQIMLFHSTLFCYKVDEKNELPAGAPVGVDFTPLPKSAGVSSHILKMCM